MKRESLDGEWLFVPRRLDSFSWMNLQDAITVNLPHDFMIANDVSPDAPGGSAVGFYKGGIGSYTKYLDIPEDWEGKRILVEIDGAYMNTEVWLNGNLVTMHPYGYTPFHADLTPYVEYGKKNRLLIIVNNSAPYNARWYTGAGLYRHVDLLTAPMVHLSPWSIFAYTNRVENRTAYVTVEVTVENHTNIGRTEHVNVMLIHEKSGEVVARGKLCVYIPGGSKNTGRVQLVVENAALWDIEDPQLYIVKAELSDKDTDSTLFGIRTITVDTKNGLMLNGRSIKLKGGCVHHDNGILGAASFYDSEYRKMELHKRHGFNAIRCAHNPPSRDMLEACDRLGLLVLNEAFDMWRMSEFANDYHLFFENWWKKDMELFMTRDRNHPCIFAWSIGNEVIERNGLSNGYELVAEIAAYARALDPTRPITSAIPVAFNGLNDEDMMKSMQAWQEMKRRGITVASLQNLGNPYIDKIWAERTEPFAAPLDFVGYNYLDVRYEMDGEIYPNRVICGTESYPKNIDLIWDKVEKLSYVIGDFTWTSYDYIGEAGLGQTAYMDPEEAKKYNTLQGPPVYFPWRLAFCGDFDLCGFERPQLHFRKIVWGSDETYVVVHHPANMGKVEVMARWGWPEAYPEWAFDGFEGKPTKVDVFSAAEEVELFINGKSLGRKPAGKANRYRAQFEVIYEPGTLTAVSLNGGVEVSRMELVTPGKASGVRVTLEKDTIKADGQSLAFAVVEIVDDMGRRVPFDDRKATAEVTGAATLAAFGTGRPVTAENYTRGQFTSYLGRYLAVVRAGYEPGEAILRINVDGLEEVKAVIRVI